MGIESGTERIESDGYPALRGLVRGYFHQDYDLISEDPDEIITAFKQEATRGQADALIGEIARFLERYAGSDEALTKAFRRVFTPEVNFYEWKFRTTEESLRKVVEILRNAAIPATPRSD